MTLAVASVSLVSDSLADDLMMTAPPEPKDMQVLFNGKDLDGWDGDPRLWSVRDGVIHGETTAENAAKGNTFLIWQGGEPADFELRLSFRCNATNNSGIQYRSSPRKARNKWAVKGYQHEVRNEVGFPNVPGFIYDEGGKRGRLNNVGQQSVYTADGKKKVIRDDLVTQAEFKKLMKLDEFNDVVIIAKGNHIQHYLNGKLIIDFKDEDPEKALSKGLIALQLHAGKPMFAEFKNIRLKVYK
ncbi:MAG: DUF1080 domain-containing protein [Planctomycetota bacterium]